MKSHPNPSRIALAARRLVHAPLREPWLVLADSDANRARLVARSIATTVTATVKRIADGTQLLDLLASCWMRSRYMGRSALPDLVVASADLPGFSGVDVLCSLADSGMRMPFIVLGTGDAADRSEVEARGGVLLGESPRASQLVAVVMRQLAREPAPAA